MYILKNTPLPEFVPLPKFILRSGLSINARLLYGLLLNRAMLSRKNGWVDGQGRVYIVYPIRRMAEDLDRSERTVKNALNELSSAGYLRRVRRGFSQPNRLYVLLPEAAPQKGRDCPPEVRKTAPAEGQNLPPNKTEREEKDLSKTERAEPAPLGHYQNVFLSQRELEELRRDFPGLLEGYIEKLSAYMKEKGKTYACHEAVLRRWLNEDSGRTKNWDDIYEEGECL